MMECSTEKLMTKSTYGSLRFFEVCGKKILKFESKNIQ